MKNILLFVLLLLVDVLAAPIANTIIDNIISKCPNNSVSLNYICVAHTEALFA